MTGCSKIGECAHGCWMAIPEDCASKTATCCTGTAVWICKDGLWEGCAQQCCWETLAKACVYDTCIKGCVVPLGSYCASGKCCIDTAACAGTCAKTCADGSVECVRCTACGCRDLTVCLATGCGNCVSESGKLVVKCGNGCAGCVASCGVRCMDPAEWAACAAATVNCGKDVCCGLMTCCRDEICCYQQCWSREQCFNGAVACAQGTYSCLACTVHLPIDCYRCMPACVDIIAYCSASCSGCAQSCGLCLADCQASCGECAQVMQARGRDCMSSCASGVCVSLPATVHAAFSRTMAFLRASGPMRLEHAVTKNLPRQAAHAGITTHTDSAWASALGASAGSNIYAQHPNMLMRGIYRWSEEQVSAFMTAYFVKLDNKWATNEAWTAFWRGDAAMDYKGRNQMLAEYKNEFRRRYNLAMCVYMDAGWTKSWGEYYPSYQEKYMQDLVANGTITPAVMTDEQFAELGRYLMSTADQKAEFQKLVGMYNDRRHVIRDQAIARIGNDPDARRQMREVTVDSRLAAVPVPRRQPVAAPSREAVEAFYQEVSPDALRAPLLDMEHEAQTHGWRCGTCGRDNHPVFNPNFCGNEFCPTNA